MGFFIKDFLQFAEMCKDLKGISQAEEIIQKWLIPFDLVLPTISQGMRPSFILLCRNFEVVHFFIKQKNHPKSRMVCNVIVEPEGFEPSSKRAIILLSTCLVFI